MLLMHVTSTVHAFLPGYHLRGKTLLVNALTLEKTQQMIIAFVFVLGHDQWLGKVHNRKSTAIPANTRPASMGIYI